MNREPARASVNARIDGTRTFGQHDTRDSYRTGRRSARFRSAWCTLAVKHYSFWSIKLALLVDKACAFGQHGVRLQSTQ
eukprot:7108444-Pyramimonas_sp.AAC.1